MKSYDIAGYHLRGFLEGMRALGLDVDELLTDSGIDRAMLADAEMRFAESQVFALWMNAEQRYAQPAFGFELATRIPFGKLELIDYLVAACPTLGAGMECFAHHARLCASGFTYRIERHTHEGEPGRRIVAEHHYPVALLPHSVSEYTWTLFLTRFRHACGPALTPVLWLRAKPNVPAVRMMEQLGCVPEIADEDALFVSEAQWKLENRYRDPMLQQLLVAHARDVHARLPENDFLSTLQSALVSAMHNGDPSIRRVAMRLGLSTRTLQRRLELERLTFQHVLEKLRHRMAIDYLRTTQLSLNEISALLGYTDATAFGRAFRRWTGRSPAAFRRDQRAAPPPPS